LAVLVDVSAMLQSFESGDDADEGI